ncbi:hypothetical protein [Vagococcus silagei]|uniref:Uncharacterized protein n=1 Tax=Vagococcus silagei TaxID=2508885 RepID=A0A4S3B0I4_9ENTE|nr:hypothetical protein [Vagococcus silagei]THB60574.1 hypothetical protein ESZ54_09530 [Vagococcus silagei]
MPEATALKDKVHTLLENEYQDTLSIGGYLDDLTGEGKTKKVNFHNINILLDRKTSYEITRDILKLQDQPIGKLHRIETYAYR